MRTLSEILIDADNATEREEIKKLGNELFDNKYKYPLVELRFAKEHLESLDQTIFDKDRYEFFKD